MERWVDMDRKTLTINLIKEDFIKCQDVLTAIGDETRQKIILALIENTCDSGMRVGEITAQTHLSRPAVSHHLKVLKEAGIITMRKEGTMTYYHIDVQSKLGLLTNLVSHIDEALKEFY